MAVPALTLNILRNPPSLATARIISTVAGLTTPAPWQAMAVGDTKSIVFSICDGQGNLETLTGRTYRVGIGNLNAPCTGGTFTLSDTLGNTTAAQPYNIDADALEDALNAFNDGAGPGNGLVTVEGPDGGPFVVIWNANGSQPLLTANVTDLEPAAVSVIAASQAGSGSQPEIQFIRLLQMPYALQSTWTVSGTTATGLLTLSSQGLYQWLAQKPNGPLFFEIEESDGTSVAKILQAPIIVTGDVVPYTTLSSPALVNTTVQSFVAAISVDALTVAITFTTAFASTPTGIAAVVSMPTSAGENIFATLIENTLSTTGCTFSLSGAPNASGYKIHGIATL